MGNAKLLLVFASLIFVSDGIRRPVLDNYDLSWIVNCTSKINVYMDRAALIAYDAKFLRTLSGEQFLNCSTTVIPRTTGGGVIAVIQHMTIREGRTGCIDEVLIGENNTGQCGRMVFGLKKDLGGLFPPTPGFISEYPGIFDNVPPLLPENEDPEEGDLRSTALNGGAWVERIHIRLRTTVKVSSEHPVEDDDDLSIATSITMYKVCDPGNLTDQWFNCGYALCILSKFVNDGVVNCPFGDCRDEGGCFNALMTSQFLTDYSKWSPYHDGSVIVHPASFLHIPLTVFSVCIMYTLYY